ncbi:hypothetical protein [Halarcobacter bivalviorum]|uniref:Uncharacterized protein n=1 Tax=Halarcobacter bivalviorum TaxID=663364 RepID=A0AAX2A7I1_9BACT|nr:hypothetical protein [Halarcobacter bivalviorum]AXH13526.1 hypothetical protein ABIV_2555 [Halarcobacter bivalviorum]RXK04961.1 hypothetical protein CRU97_08805 [Halarcobacter bivalviorum]RXK09879.1 hypothetical protein CRV05_05720 [Halarcobacter bivalviorum]
MNFTESLTKHIDKLVGTLKSEEDLKEVLKRKLTKKELKVFIAIEEGKSIQETMELIKDDEERVEELYKVACKKVNQEKIKKELVDL